MGLDQTQVREITKKLIKRPKDAASENDHVTTNSTAEQTVASSGGTNPNEVFTNSSGETRFLEQVTWAISSNYSDNLRLKVEVRDSQDSTVAVLRGNPMNFPLDFDPAFPVEDGGDVNITATNPTASSVTYFVSTTTRQKE